MEKLAKNQQENSVDRDIWGPESVKHSQQEAGIRKGDLRGVGVGKTKERACLKTGN